MKTLGRTQLPETSPGLIPAGEWGSTRASWGVKKGILRVKFKLELWSPEGSLQVALLCCCG